MLVLVSRLTQHGWGRDHGVAPHVVMDAALESGETLETRPLTTG